MKTKNKFIIIALVCLITISSVWAGRTYAYFTASNNASGTITMGTLKVNDFGELNAETNLKVVPNQTVTKNFKATIESDIKYYKRLSLSAEVKAETGKTHETTCGDYVDDDTKILNATVANFEKYTDDDGAIYYYDLTPVTPSNNNLTEEEFTINIAVHDWVGAGGCDYYMGATINIGVKIEVIQADYLEDNGLANASTFTAATLHAIWGSVVGSSGGATPTPTPSTDTYTRVNADGNEDSNGNYILFGYYPKTIKADNVTVSSTADSDGYYLGSDGERYAKFTANPYDSSYTFSNGDTITKGTEYYFKLEQIKWRILTESNGQAMLLAEDIIDAHYYDSSANNYANSKIREWLNSTFLSKFTTAEQAIIQTTTIDNSLASTGDSSNSYVCEDSNDKIFLLSRKELITEAYGFPTSTTADNSRIRKPTDYAKANRAYIYTGSDNEYDGNGRWWSRSPYCIRSDYAWSVTYNGFASNGCPVANTVEGVVPAMWITL